MGQRLASQGIGQPHLAQHDQVGYSFYPEMNQDASGSIKKYFPATFLFWVDHPKYGLLLDRIVR